MLDEMVVTDILLLDILYLVDIVLQEELRPVKQ